MKITQARVRSDVDLSGLSFYNFYNIDIPLGAEAWRQNQTPIFRNLFTNIYLSSDRAIFNGQFHFFQSSNTTLNLTRDLHC